MCIVPLLFFWWYSFPLHPSTLYGYQLQSAYCLFAHWCYKSVNFIECIQTFKGFINDKIILTYTQHVWYTHDTCVKNKYWRCMIKLTQHSVQQWQPSLLWQEILHKYDYRIPGSILGGTPAKAMLLGMLQHRSRYVGNCPET